MVNIGLFGFGYWGPNMARNFSNIGGSQVKKIVDVNEKRLDLAKQLYRSTEVSTDPEFIFNDPDIDAVVIALPVSHHFEFGKRALETGKHALIEKPMTNSRDDALTLADLAQKNNRVLMVDHTFLYTGAVEKIKELITTGELGDIRYFDSTRINLGLFQSDINVVWDLAPHDLSILRYLIDETPGA